MVNGSAAGGPSNGNIPLPSTYWVFRLWCVIAQQFLPISVLSARSIFNTIDLSQSCGAATSVKHGIVLFFVYI